MSCSSNSKEPCDKCHGTGKYQACDGDGIFTVGNNITGEWESSFCYSCGSNGKCSNCNGTGKDKAYTIYGTVIIDCGACNGTGKCQSCGGDGKKGN